MFSKNDEKISQTFQLKIKTNKYIALSVPNEKRSGIEEYVMNHEDMSLSNSIQQRKTYE